MAKNIQSIIFLSYAKEDTAIVKEIYNDLKKYGFNPWMDIYDILPGQIWKETILNTIRKASIFIICLSPNSTDKRGMIQVEIKEALEVWKEKLKDDIFFIPLRIHDCKVPPELTSFQWLDLNSENGFIRLTKALRTGLQKLNPFQKISLRSESVRYQSRADILAMIQEKDFFDKERNWVGRGIKNQFEPVTYDNVKFVIDHSTGLTWRLSGSKVKLNSKEARGYLNELRRISFAGFNDWRIPTLEEAFSLMKPEIFEGFHYSEIFSKKHKAIWTVDRVKNYGLAVDFRQGKYVIAMISEAFYPSIDKNPQAVERGDDHFYIKIVRNNL